MKVPVPLSEYISSMSASVLLDSNKAIGGLTVMFKHYYYYYRVATHSLGP